MSEELLEKTVSDWSTYNPGSHKDIKKIIQDNINSVCANYVAIGYYLNIVNDRELYKEDGYSGIGEYAAAEYGIQKDKCSYLMKIADKFCIDNSPALLPEYRDFSVSKLREMIYLTNEQLDQVAITTTVAEIREIRKPEPQKVATSQLGPETNKSEAKYILDKLMSEYYCGLSVWKRFLEETIQNIGKDEAVKNFFQFHAGHGQDIKADSKCPGYGFTFYTAGKGTANIEMWYADQRVRLSPDEFMILFLNHKVDNTETKPSGKCIHRSEFTCTLQEASKLAQGDGENCNAKCCWNCEKRNGCGYQCNSSAHRPVVTDSVEPEPEYIEPVTKEQEIENDVDNPYKSCSNCKYDTMDPDEYFADHPGTKEFPCNRCDDKLSNWESQVKSSELIKDPDLSCKFDPDARCLIASKKSCKRNSNDGCMNCSGSWGEEDYIAVEPEQNFNSEPVETVEADIIQTVPEEPFTDQCEASGLKFNNWLKANGSSIADIVSIVLYDKKIPDKDNLHAQIQNSLISRLITKTEAYYSYLTSELGIEPERPKQIQPELPIFKNNDQRKEWAENYKAWDEWYCDEHIDCHYYKYDFPNGDRLIVDEYRDREYYWSDKKKDEQHYHLLQKKKPAYGGTKTFEQKYMHQTSSMTEIVDYLKDFQKK